MVSIETIHPMLVHFPVVFILTLAAFDVIVVAFGISLDRPACTANVSAGLALLAALAAVAAYVFGDIAYDAALSKGIPEARLETHQLFGTIAMSVIVSWGLARGLVWWRRKPVARRYRWGFAAIELSIAALVVVTAFYGGQLVYEFGVNVAPSAP